MSIDELKTLLHSFPVGPIEDTEEIESRLTQCWESFSGSDDTKMHAGKLARNGSLENASWNPPILSFDVERHGAMVGGGSSRAELQHWMLNIETRTATIAQHNKRFRQIGGRSSSFTTEDAITLAEKLVTLVATGADDARIKWRDGKNQVEFLMRNIPPCDSGFKETLSKRRKRLRAALKDAMDQIGWILKEGSTSNMYVRKPTPSSSPMLSERTTPPGA